MALSYIAKEKFFDRVNHDRLMMKLAEKVEDKKVLLLIRKYLQSGVMENGIVQPTIEGAPQGGLCKASHKAEPFHHYLGMFTCMPSTSGLRENGKTNRPSSHTPRIRSNGVS